MPTLCRDKYASAEGLDRGAYVLAAGPGTPDVILIGTGSEVHLALEARGKTLATQIPRDQPGALEAYEALAVRYPDEAEPALAKIAASLEDDAGAKVLICDRDPGGLAADRDPPRRRRGGHRQPRRVGVRRRAARRRPGPGRCTLRRRPLRRKTTLYLAAGYGPNPSG